MRGDALDSYEFYELMQSYRHAPIEHQEFVTAQFEAVKSFIRSKFRRKVKK